ncbi:hypothetical protein D3C80_2000940 [compost metagenome]
MDGGGRSIIRCTARAARSAISGATVTSNFMSRRQSRMFSRVMRFMCGHRLHGPIKSTPGTSPLTFEAMEHSVIITTCLGLRAAT